MPLVRAGHVEGTAFVSIEGARLQVPGGPSMSTHQPPPPMGEPVAYGAPASPPPPPPAAYPPPPAPAYALQPYYQQVIVQARNNGLAIASLVLGICWIYWVGSVLAVIFGHVALGQIARSNGTQQGRGMAVAGLVLGWIGVAILLIILLAAAGSSSA
jgi:hypothetical protein